MRFSRSPYHKEARPWTPRRLAIQERRIAKEKASLGFFADQFHVDTLSERTAELDQHTEGHIQYIRSAIADQWIRGRRLVHSLPRHQRSNLVVLWNASPVPATSEYFLDFLRSFGVADG